MFALAANCEGGFGLGVLVQLADFIHRKALEEAQKEALLLQRDPARPLRSDHIDLSALPAWRRGSADD